jgi:hypothetical protein
MRTSIYRTALAVPLMLALAGWGGGGAQRRHDADDFILDKLRQQRGETWQRVGHEFLWDYGFDRKGCELTVQRLAPYGSRFVQIIPVGDTVPTWRHDEALSFLCRDTRDCIVERTQNVGGSGPATEERRVGQARVLVPDPNDLPKLADAFTELNRLCDDAYRLNDREEGEPAGIFPARPEKP